MNKRERDILRMEQDIKDTLENELAKTQTENKVVKVKDVKLVGDIEYKDKISGKISKQSVFVVEKEVKEINKNGKESVTKIENYYLGDKCIAASLDDGELVYSSDFKVVDFEKMSLVQEFVDKTSDKELEKNSLEKLELKESEEVLTAHLDKKENNLSKKQVEKVKVNGIQKVDLNRLIDGRETLGKRLDLAEYDSMYVVYSDKVDGMTTDSNNTTTYSLVGMKNNGEAKVLNDEFEIDSAVGNSGNRQSTKIRANSTATRDNKDVSVYRRKSNNASIGCENNFGNVDMFFYQKTLEENENVGIQIETNKTQIIPIQTREIMNRNKGVYHKEDVQNEIQEHTDEKCNPDDVKDFDGYDATSTHEHLETQNIDDYVLEIFNYEDENGEEKIKEVFTENEIREKLEREIAENKETLTLEQIVQNVKDEMNSDAENLSRERRDY